jgi:Ni,Fe-hydrogenase I large subunit
MKILKMKQLIEGFNPQPIVPVQEEKAWTTEEKKAALEAIGRYNEYGNHLRREHNLMEIAHTLAQITEAAKKFALTETNEKSEEGWFDSNTVNKNMQQLQKITEEFNKLAKEAHVTQQRMEALYEDGGHVLSRYFEINDLNEGSGPAVSKINK